MTKKRIQKIEELFDMKYDGKADTYHTFKKNVSKNIVHSLWISTWFKYDITLYKVNMKTTEVEELDIDNDVYKKLTNY